MITENGVSFQEKVSRRMERQGRILNPTQIEGMRKACGVRSLSLPQLRPLG